MPFYTMPTEAELTTIACFGLAENYLEETAAQLGKDKSKINACVIKACLKTSLENNVYTQTFYSEDGNPRAIFGMSPSGAVTYVEAVGTSPHMRAKWAKATRTLPEMLMRATGTKPWCYSDARNGKAERLLHWYHFKNDPLKDITINGYKFKYYSYVPVAES